MRDERLTEIEGTSATGKAKAKAGSTKPVEWSSDERVFSNSSTDHDWARRAGVTGGKTRGSSLLVTVSMVAGAG
jgi:hypothetical protein